MIQSNPIDKLLQQVEYLNELLDEHLNLIIDSAGHSIPYPFKVTPFSKQVK